MAISNAPSQVATSALQAIPFSSMIGGPLKACIEAQAMAAKTTWDFIQEVGLNQNPETGEKSAVNVAFSFNQNGRMVQLNVPLLTIVPIPYIAIHSIDINFKASISASSSSVSENSSSTSLDAGADITTGIKVGPFHMDAKFNANYSSKKDSKATEESKYSVEYTMDIAVKAGQDSMPAGLAKVLELLGNSLDVSDPKGELEVNARVFKTGDKLIASYKNKDGLFEPAAIKCDALTLEQDGDNMVAVLGSTGSFEITAGERKIKVEVK
ncbi:DUF2589 domain-containing protein [Bacteroides caecigallinarum]|uniref:DUF2589 domain-containing protein n=1 Tax=Bacteroides caecigallinarum TaxID=1411144 RepID=UPI001F3F9C8B|nr:DUF2589 domain-containing protein [Bacteroides caecigallinarum]MCF2593896.1 DUF2589 domain-containing protein [Bacteroides caecigallinarum]